MTNTELGFAAILASFIALPMVAKLFSEILDWIFSKLMFRKSDRGAGRPAKT